MKRIKQTAAELALDLFKYQIRFLPMPKPDRDKAIEAQAKGYGLRNKK